MTTLERTHASALPGLPPGAGTGWTEVYMGGDIAAERELLDEAMPGVNRIQDLVAAKQRASVRRAFHNKGTVVAVRLDVANDLPDILYIGWLIPGASYHGFGRFSRSQSFRRDDLARDQRGFAFRIETPDGAQDFLFSNTPASFARDPLQFMKVTTLFAESPLPIAALRVVPAVGLREGVRILRDLLRAPDRQLPFTGQRYWTRTSFELGDVAARFFVRPSTRQPRLAPGDDPDFLTTHLAADLRERDRALELCAQLFIDEASTPIEDSSRVWDERVSPPIVVGTVTIPRQDLDAPDSRALAERVEALEAFNPIVTPGFRPIGRMNRARVLAYARSADHRRRDTGPA